MESNKKIYIFDLDGTLVDSVYALDNSTKKFFVEQNLECPDNIVEIITPLGYTGAAEYIRSLGVNMEVDELTQKMKEGMVAEYETNIPAKPFVTEVLKRLHSEGHLLCILSASPHFLIDPCITRLGIDKLFYQVWSTDDFDLKKSDQRIYKEAARLLGAKESECIFVDDNLTNIRTAKEAGLYTIGVYDMTSKNSADALKQTADRYVYSFDEF